MAFVVGLETVFDAVLGTPFDGTLKPVFNAALGTPYAMGLATPCGKPWYPNGPPGPNIGWLGWCHGTVGWVGYICVNGLSAGFVVGVAVELFIKLDSSVGPTLMLIGG